MGNDVDGVSTVFSRDFKAENYVSTALYAKCLHDLTFNSGVSDRVRHGVPDRREESDESDSGELHCEVSSREIW